MHWLSRIACLLVLVLATGLSPVSNAAPAACDFATRASSGAQASTIVELYTSEGCDSCPPADKWFSTLSYEKNGIVPLAFHVDYWDYIGWKDRFGKVAFAERQRTTVTRQGSRTVYTPQVMLDGKDMRAWSFNSGFQSGVREALAKPARASLALDARTVADNIEVALKVSVPDVSLRGESVLFLAVAENKLLSRVTAGENKGVNLNHDHVVRELIGPIALRADGALDIRRTIPVAADWKRADLEVAVFVQNQRNGEVLQALSGALCRP